MGRSPERAWDAQCRCGASGARRLVDKHDGAVAKRQRNRRPVGKHRLSRHLATAQTHAETILLSDAQVVGYVQRAVAFCEGDDALEIERDMNLVQMLLSPLPAQHAAPLFLRRGIYASAIQAGPTRLLGTWQETEIEMVRLPGCQGLQLG